MGQTPQTDLYGDLLFSGMQARFGTSRFRYPRLSGLTMSGDARFVAAGSASGGVLVWKASTGKQLFKAERSGRVHAVCFSPTDRRLVSVGSDGLVRIWDLVAGKPSQTLQGHRDQVFCAAWSPDGTKLVTGGGGDGSGKDRWGRVWDMSSGEVLHELKGARGDVLAAAFSSDGKRVALAGGTIVRVYDTDSGDKLADLKEATDTVTDLDFAPDGTLWAAAEGKDHSLHRWSASHDAHTAFELPAGLAAVAVSPDGNRVAVGCGDGFVRVVNAHDGAESLRIAAQASPITEVVWSPEGTVLITLAGGRHAPRMWEVHTGRRITKGDGHEGAVVAMAAARDGKRLYTAGEDNAVIRWGENGRFNGAIQIRDPDVPGEPTWKGTSLFVATRASDVATSGDGKVLVAAYRNRLVLLEGVDGAELPAELAVLDEAIHIVGVSPDGGTAVCGHGNHLEAFRIPGGDLVFEAELTAPAQALAFEGSTVLAACNDVEVRRWKLADGAYLDSVTGKVGFTGKITTLSRDGALGAARTGAGIEVWDTETGEVLHTLRETGSVRALAFSPDKLRLAAGFGDGAIAIATLATGDAHFIGGQEAGVNQMIWLEDGRLLTGGDDSTCVAWTLE